MKASTRVWHAKLRFGGKSTLDRDPFQFVGKIRNDGSGGRSGGPGSGINGIDLKWFDRPIRQQRDEPAIGQLGAAPP